MNLQTGENIVRDIEFKDEWKIGENYCQLYTMADAEFVPPLCGSRINYDKYSTDKTKFSVGFASPIGQLLSCNHIYSQYVFIDDMQKTIQKLESKRLRLQSLSAYSRENSIAKDSTDNFLNEAIGEQSLPVKAHFNLLAWTYKSGYDSIAIRLWYDYASDEKDVIEIRKHCDGWVGEYTKIVSYLDNGKVYNKIGEKGNLYPKSGWDLFTKKIFGLGIITLPHFGDIPDYNPASDGYSIDVKIATKEYYRIYTYLQPRTKKIILKMQIP